jgi:hypothetical protein
MSLFSSAKKGDCFTTRGGEKVEYVGTGTQEEDHLVKHASRDEPYWVQGNGLAISTGRRWDITGPWRGPHEIPAIEGPDTEEERRGET